MATNENAPAGAGAVRCSNTTEPTQRAERAELGGTGSRSPGRGRVIVFADALGAGSGSPGNPPVEPSYGKKTRPQDASGSTESSRRARRSRFSRASAGPRERTKFGRRSIQPRRGADKLWTPQIVGIAPNSLLFHSNVKKGAILSVVTKGVLASCGLAIMTSPSAKSKMTKLCKSSADVISLIRHCQIVMRHTTSLSSTVRRGDF